MLSVSLIAGMHADTFTSSPVYGLPVVMYGIPISAIERGKLVLVDPAIDL